MVIFQGFFVCYLEVPIGYFRETCKLKWSLPEGSSSSPFLPTGIPSRCIESILFLLADPTPFLFGLNLTFHWLNPPHISQFPTTHPEKKCKHIKNHSKSDYESCNLDHEHSFFSPELTRNVRLQGSKAPKRHKSGIVSP